MRQFSILFFTLLTATVTMAQVSTNQDNKATLIYVGDPMCSWCYGLSEELTAVREHYGDDLDYELVLGGLRPYNTETMTDLRDFLTHHWEDVNKASGQPFSYEILDNSEITYDTEPPCRAVRIVRELDADSAFDFFGAVQSDFYLNNKNLHLAESYHESIEKYTSLSIEEFDTAFASAKAKEDIKLDFQRSSELGVRSFPTIILKVNGEHTVVAKGFLRASQMQGNIDIVRSR